MLRAIVILALVVATTSHPPIPTPVQRTKPAEVSSQHQHPSRQATPQPNATGAMKENHAKEAQRDGGTKTSSGDDPPNPPADPWPNRFQAVTAIATALYFVATVFIFCEMRRFNRRALSLSLASNRQTKKAADAAKSSAETAKLALKTLERADVLVETIDIFGSDYDRKPHRAFFTNTICKVTLKNYGRSRAEHLFVDCTLVIQGEPQKKSKPMTVLIVDSVLGAGVRTELTFPNAGTYFKQETLDGANHGRLPCYVVVRITYNDIFGGAHPIECFALFLSDIGSFHLAHKEVDQRQST